MNTFSKLVVRGIALGAGLVATVATVLPSPVSAAQFSRTHFTVDVDNVVLGNDPADDRYFGFVGGIESFHDGERITAGVVGDLESYSSLRVTFHLDNGVLESERRTSADRTMPIFIVSDVPDDVVKVTIEWSEPPKAYGGEFAYVPDRGEATRVYYVGDSPDSLGRCEQLDLDKLSLSTSQSSMQGTVQWGCHASTGRVFARIHGNLRRSQNATENSFVSGRIEYSDGSTTPFLTRTVDSATPERSFTINSDPNKHARYVDIEIDGRTTRLAGTWVKFGDA